MNLIIGIDDTDNLDSKGTGHLARDLGTYLHQLNIFETRIIIRHQLFVHVDIPYTSHNSSASLSGILKKDFNDLATACETFLTEKAAEGSDVGLCLYTEEANHSDKLIQWGIHAKNIILTEENAYKLATESGIYLKGLTGRKTGVIGALAAVGLALEGNDGRVLWMKALRETTGMFSVNEIKNIIGIDVIMTEDATVLDDKTIIELGDWNRPVIRNHKSILYVEPKNINNYEYKTASKHFIKSISE
ncbi:MAG: hypothetical protein PHT69_13665 [Bacteroidales bacterium]|nr:hypothetical protein [Bacteroidales bacterium]